MEPPRTILAPRTAPDPRDDQWTIGCEVLDRDFAKFSAYRDYLPKLGIRSIRLQGGWAKCERERGRYDFAWLDECVDFALAHGLNPILETDYGNPLYKGGGGRDLAERRHVARALVHLPRGARMDGEEAQRERIEHRHKRE